MDVFLNNIFLFKSVWRKRCRGQSVFILKHTLVVGSNVSERRSSPSGWDNCTVLRDKFIQKPNTPVIVTTLLMLFIQHNTHGWQKLSKPLDHLTNNNSKKIKIVILDTYENWMSWFFLKSNRNIHNCNLQNTIIQIWITKMFLHIYTYLHVRKLHC